MKLTAIVFLNSGRKTLHGPDRCPKIMRDAIGNLLHLHNRTLERSGTLSHALFEFGVGLDKLSLSLLQRLFGAFPLRDVAGDLRRPDDDAMRVFDRRHSEGDV